MRCKHTYEHTHKGEGNAKSFESLEMPKRCVLLFFFSNSSSISLPMPSTHIHTLTSVPQLCQLYDTPPPRPPALPSLSPLLLHPRYQVCYLSSISIVNHPGKPNPHSITELSRGELWWSWRLPGLCVCVREGEKRRREERLGVLRLAYFERGKELLRELGKRAGRANKD